MSNIFLIAINIWIFPDAMAVPLISPVRSMIIPYNDEIIIDGAVDEGYSASQSTIAFSITGSTGADADFTASFRACYNLQRLYLLATILDDYASEMPYTTGPSPWTWDNMEVFISLDTTGTTVAYDENTTHLIFNRGIQDSASWPGRAQQSEYTGNVCSVNNADGWVLEVGIPWTAVLSLGHLPEDIESYLSAVHGFDIMFSDSDFDAPDARDCQTEWDEDNPPMPDATEDLAWNNRTVFGIMTLAPEGFYTPPVANAGTDQTVDENTLVTLDGSASWDPEGETLNYLWSAPSAISFDRHSAVTSFFAPEVSNDTNYYISLIVENSTISSAVDSLIIHVNQLVATKEFEEDPYVTLSPNPANQLMNIKSGKLIYSIEIIDLSGDIIWQKTINSMETEINIGSFAASNYILRLNTEAGIVTKQIVLE